MNRAPPLPEPPFGRRGWPWYSPDQPPADAAGGPLVTIVTPSFNQGEYIEACLRSVLLQDYPHLEYLVIDGGSQDNTLAVLERYAPWLSGWVSEPDDGQAAAINKGMARSSGSILGWLNADDLYEPGAISAAVAALEANPEAALLFGNAVEIGADGGRLGQTRQRPAVTRQTLLTQGTLPQPATLFRRVAWLAAGGLDERLHYCLDWELWLRLLAAGPALWLDQALAQIRVHAAAKTGSADRRFLDELAEVIRRHGGDGLPADALALVAWLRHEKAHAACDSGEWATGQAALAGAIELAEPLGRPATLGRLMADWAWQTAPGLAGDDRRPLSFLAHLGAALPANASDPAQARRQAESLLAERLADRSRARGQAGAALGHLARGWRRGRRLPTRAEVQATLALLARRRRPAAGALAVARRAEQRLLAWLEPLARGPAGLATLGVSENEFAPACAWLYTLAERRRPAEWPATSRDQWRDYLLAQRHPAAGCFGPLPADDLDAPLWRTTWLAWTCLRALAPAAAPPLPRLAELMSEPGQGRLFAALGRAPAGQAVTLVASLGHLLLAQPADSAPGAAALAWRLIDWLDCQQSSATGWWRLDPATGRQGALADGALLGPLYLAGGRPVAYFQRLLATALALQRPDGHFGPAATAGLADLAAAWALAQAERQPGERYPEARLARLYLARAILARQREDGDFGPPAESEELAQGWYWGQALRWLIAAEPAPDGAPLP
jgi:GT2 family glycosyltransferase